MGHLRSSAWLLAGSGLALASAVRAGETTTYSYDALGRLTATSTTGTVNNGVATGIAYDPAGNRSSYGVSGGPGPPPSPPQAGLRSMPVGGPGEDPSCESLESVAVAGDRDPGGGAPTVTALNGNPAFAVPSRTAILSADGGQPRPSSAGHASSDAGGTSALVQSDVPKAFCP